MGTVGADSAWQAPAGRPETPTHSQHALLKVPRHLPADALLNVSARHSLILIENWWEERRDVLHMDWTLSPS